MSSTGCGHHATADEGHSGETTATQRDHHIAEIEQHSRIGWQRRLDYDHRSVVKTATYRYKIIVGRLHARTLPNQRVKAKIDCNVIARCEDMTLRYSPWPIYTIPRFIHAPTCRPCARQRTCPMRIERLDVHRPIPTRAHDLCEALGIVPVGLVHPHLARGAGLSRVQANHVEPALAQLIDPPWRHRTSFNPNAGIIARMPPHSPLNQFRP
jgi:hypothetical protein